MSEVPWKLRGDGPCRICKTYDNIRWFTDNVLWNEVVPGGGILCVPCFIAAADEAGLSPRAWRLLPEWHWETADEKRERLARRGQ